MQRRHQVTGSLLALLLTLSHPAGAGPLDDGLAAFNAGDYAQAFAIWKPLAEAGDIKARYNLGLMFQQGLGVAKDPHQARQLFAAAAKQGDADAQYQLGFIYYQGEGVFRSNKDAHHWWSLAAAQHHPRAQYNLAVLHAYGIGIATDHDKALKLWHAASMQGYRDAIEVMIRVYQNGEFGVTADPSKAAEWRQRLGE
ncbi:MAG: sel1 repeat family protein [Gammaproteobacteria bacterium]|nr:sel1 repeat family protein [Gammaproteobacteria bacterium]